MTLVQTRTTGAITNTDLRVMAKGPDNMKKEVSREGNIPRVQVSPLGVRATALPVRNRMAALIVPREEEPRLDSGSPGDWSVERHGDSP